MNRRKLIKLSRNPKLYWLFATCTFVGCVLGTMLLPEDWTPTGRIFGGFLGGFGCALIILTSRMIGAYDIDEPS